MKPRVTTWKKRPRVSSVVATAPKASNGVDALLGAIKKRGKTKKKASDKPLVILEDRAEQLLNLQQMKSQQKTLKGAIDALEGELFPKIEGLRLAVNREKNQYIGSIHVQATGPVNAGQVLYYVMNKYVGFDPTETSSDEDLQESCDGEATLLDEAIQAISTALDVSEDEASELLTSKMETSHSLSLEESALKDPEVIQILQEYLAEHLVSKTRMKPSKTFHERSSFEETDKAIMGALSGIGLVKRYKAVLKASGAPK